MADTSRSPLRLLLTLAAVAALFFFLFQVQQAKMSVGATESAVRKVLDDQVEAWNAGKLDDFMTGYWRDEQLTFFSGGSVSQGWQAAFDRYRKNYQQDGKEMGQLVFSDVVVEVLSADAAFVRGRWQLTLSNGDRPGGLFTLLFRKKADGWRVVHDHTSKS